MDEDKIKTNSDGSINFGDDTKDEPKLKADELLDEVENEDNGLSDKESSLVEAETKIEDEYEEDTTIDEETSENIKKILDEVNGNDETKEEEKEEDNSSDEEETKEIVEEKVSTEDNISDEKDIYEEIPIDEPNTTEETDSETEVKEETSEENKDTEVKTEEKVEEIKETTKEEKEETKKKHVPAILFIILGMLIGALGVYALLTYGIPVEETTVDDSEQPEETTVVDIDAAKEKAFKEFYTSNGYVLTNNVITWDVSIKEEGSNYIIFTNTYICEDDTSSCIYSEQSEETDNGYTFDIKAYGSFSGDKLKITSVESTVQTTSEDESLDVSTYSVKILDYLVSNGLVIKPNLESYKVNSIEYVGYYTNIPSEKYYKVKATYSCTDLTSDCVYQEQSDDSEDGAYNYTFGIIVSNGEITSLTDDLLLTNNSLVD